METKQCTKCLETKSLSEFYFRKPLNKYETRCRECIKQEKKIWEQKNKEKHKEQSKLWKEEHKEQIREYNKLYKIKNKNRLDIQNKEYRKKNKEKCCNATKLYYQKNKEKVNEKSKEYRKKRRKIDSTYRLKLQIRSMINNSFRRNGHTKNEKTEKVVGCSIEFLTNYLLQTYEDNYGMEWDKIEKVDIDHIMPLASAKTVDEIIKLCHYTNLQLLKHKDNLIKGSKIYY